MFRIRHWTRTNGTTCTLCGQPLHPHTIHEVRAEAGSVAITFFGLPCLSCSKPGHPRIPLHRDFAADLLDTLLTGREVPIARLGNLSSERLWCYHCGNRLPGRAKDIQTVTAQIALRAVPAFRVSIAGPTGACHTCGRQQILADVTVASYLSEAVAQAFERIELVA